MTSQKIFSLKERQLLMVCHKSCAAFVRVLESISVVAFDTFSVDTGSILEEAAWVVSWATVVCLVVTTADSALRGLERTFVQNTA